MDCCECMAPAKAGEHPMRGRFSAPICRGSHCAGARARVCRLRDSSKSNGNRPPVSAGGRCFRGGGQAPAASCQLHQWDACRVAALRFLPAVFHQEKNRLPQAFDAFFLRATLPVRLGDFRAKCNEPLAFTMHFRSKWKIHMLGAYHDHSKWQHLGATHLGAKLFHEREGIRPLTCTECFQPPTSTRFFPSPSNNTAHHDKIHRRKNSPNAIPGPGRSGPARARKV